MVKEVPGSALCLGTVTTEDLQVVFEEKLSLDIFNKVRFSYMHENI